MEYRSSVAYATDVELDESLLFVPRPSARQASAPPPVSSARKPPRRRAPRWARFAVVFGAVLMVLSGGSLVAIVVAVDRYTGAVQQEDMLGDAGVAAKPPGKTLVGPLNLLLVGVDERTDEEDPNGTRADSMIVVHITASRDMVYLLSVPRDTLVDIPAFARSKFRGGREKINAAFQHGSENGGGRRGGFELLATTVNKVTGINFDAGAIINFAGFQAVVAAMGGVDMCIDQKVTSIHLNVKGDTLRKGGPPAVYQPGCRHLEPWQALDYVRQRHTPEADYDRQRHQQQFLKAIGKQALGKGIVTNPGKLDGVLSAAGRALTVDPGRASLTDWAFLLKDFRADQIAMLKTNGGSFSSVKCPDGSSCQQLTQESRDMFAAARSDALADFLLKHQDWLATDK
jgi:LCP family protein required for cell wall assembly